MREIDKIKQNENITAIKKLCIEHPKLNMNELAHCLSLSIEQVYQIIKEYNLPYYWKFTENQGLTNEREG
ncbi:hypothetical protein [Enterococcus sp. DIV1420a]|uniref:hypothetical protein n=1 Tax=Enterococcus sp. DIV1420a TaxID=2774672 RepID=UPI003F21B695